MTLRKDEDKESKKTSPFILFLIGISAGGIAASFPRIMTFLSTGNDNVQITLFSGAFLLATGAFALIVGISMIWLYMGTSDTTKNLFMAALALPSILSGGINMSNTAAVGQSHIESLSAVNKNLEKRLAEAEKIPTIPSITFDDAQEVSFHGNIIPGGFGISAAYAAEEKGSGSYSFNPSVQFAVPTDRSDYIILLDESSDKNELLEKLKTYQDKIPNLEIKRSKDTYYLIQGHKKKKSDALLEAIEIKSTYGLSPKLLEVKQ